MHMLMKDAMDEITANTNLHAINTFFTDRVFPDVTWRASMMVPVLIVLSNFKK